MSRNKYEHPKCTEKKLGFGKWQKFENFQNLQIFSMPFGCTYLFWDGPTSSIQNLMNFRIQSISISAFKNKNSRFYVLLKFTLIFNKKYEIFSKNPPKNVKVQKKCEKYQKRPLFFENFWVNFKRNIKLWVFISCARYSMDCIL